MTLWLRLGRFFVEKKYKWRYNIIQVRAEKTLLAFVCLYFGVAVIKLLSLTSVSCYQILKNSKKLKHFEVPKKDALKVIH